MAPKQTIMLPDEVLIKIAHVCVEPSYDIVLEPHPRYIWPYDNPRWLEDSDENPFILKGQDQLINVKLSNSLFNTEIRKAIRRNFSGNIMNKSKFSNIIDLLSKYQPKLLPSISVFTMEYIPSISANYPQFHRFGNLKLIQVDTNFTCAVSFDKHREKCGKFLRMMNLAVGDKLDEFLEADGKLRYQFLVDQKFEPVDGQDVEEGPQSVKFALEETKKKSVWMIGDESKEEKENRKKAFERHLRG